MDDSQISVIFHSWPLLLYLTLDKIYRKMAKVTPLPQNFSHNLFVMELGKSATYNARLQSGDRHFLITC